jgi:hypothetical protein
MYAFVLVFAFCDRDSAEDLTNKEEAEIKCGGDVAAHPTGGFRTEPMDKQVCRTGPCMRAWGTPLLIHLTRNEEQEAQIAMSC